MATTEKDRILAFRGESLRDRNGEKLGTIEEIYLDAQTDEPEWALVHTGLFGARRSFVPLSGARERDGALTVQFDKETVKGAPKVEAHGQLSLREESELYGYYGIERPALGGAGGRRR
jgi:hypothetical protein